MGLFFIMQRPCFTHAIHGVRPSGSLPLCKMLSCIFVTHAIHGVRPSGSLPLCKKASMHFCQRNMGLFFIV
jgi:hypothetical protein